MRLDSFDALVVGDCDHRGTSRSSASSGWSLRILVRRIHARQSTPAVDARRPCVAGALLQSPISSVGGSRARELPVGNREPRASGFISRLPPLRRARMRDQGADAAEPPALSCRDCRSVRTRRVLHGISLDIRPNPGPRSWSEWLRQSTLLRALAVCSFRGTGHVYLVGDRSKRGTGAKRAGASPGSRRLRRHPICPLRNAWPSDGSLTPDGWGLDRPRRGRDRTRDDGDRIGSVGEAAVSRRSRAASGSASIWRGFCGGNRACCCSTNRRPDLDPPHQEEVGRILPSKRRAAGRR